MAHIANRRGLSEAWIHAYNNLDYDKVGWRSTTGLIAPARATLLRERHDEEITVDISDLMWMMIGSGVHAILERTNKVGIINEQRFIVNHHGVPISMKPDWLEKLSIEEASKFPGYAPGKVFYRLDDFKVIQVIAAQRTIKESKFEYEAQLNIYRWGLYQQGFTDIVDMNIQALLRDWTYRDGVIRRLYDLPPACRIPISIWPMERTEAYLDERIAIYKAAEKESDETLPICTAQERWATPDCWKVVTKAKGNTVPHGIVSTKAEAEAIIKAKKKPSDYDLKYCQGRSPRCDIRFCPAGNFCNIRHNFVKGTDDGIDGGSEAEVAPSEFPTPEHAEAT